MQVFTPYADVHKSVQCLDPSRLGNQIYRECLTLARGGWPNHPVSIMWRYHTYALCEYALAGLRELQHRGRHYPDTFDKFHDIQLDVPNTGFPEWWGDSRVHDSHKSMLLRKDYSHYQQFGWQYQVPAQDYYWPVPKEPKEIEKYLHERLKKLQPAIREFHQLRPTPVSSVS